MSEKNVKDLGFQTRAVHTGNGVDGETGAIKRPITMANSYELPYDPSDLNWSSAGKNLYTRNGGSNQQYLQEKVASLEGGEDCVVLASGVAALSGLFFALLKSGDHVIFSSVTYIAVYRLLNELLNNKFGVETTIVDTSDPENVRKAIRPNTKLIHIETRATPHLQFRTSRRLQTLRTKTMRCYLLTIHLLLRTTKDPLSLARTFRLKALQNISTVTVTQWAVLLSVKKNTSTSSEHSRRLTSVQQSARSMLGLLCVVRLLYRLE